MKKLSTISLFVFGVFVTAILTAGLVFYQNGKNSSGNQNKVSSDSLIRGEINKINPSGGTITLDMAEIVRHNKSSDCWMLISGNVYDITSFFGSHPGGNSVMAKTCGTDATAAYLTKDPNAKNTSNGQDHSSQARNMLKDYYLGTLNQVLGLSDKTTSTNNSTSINKTTTSSNVGTPSPAVSVKSDILNDPSIIPAANITLTLSEIAKHNKQTDCFLLISGKVYNITSFFGSHPGGNGVMAQTCGTDATAAYLTKDPNATASGSRSSHSSSATSMLTSYYIGDLNQNIGQQKITETNAVTAPANTGDDDGEEFEDD